MYRNNAMSTTNQDLENDDNYEFAGATLKISDNESNAIRYHGEFTSNAESSILSGLDMTSPIPPSEREINENNKEHSTDKNGNSTSETEIFAADFFSFRSGQFDKAVNDCIELLLRPSNDTNILGSWLLTEVSHWDHERERLFILTSRTFNVIKYDFIALRILHYNQIRLERIDTVLKGKLTYPQTSLVPRIEGITNGFASVICGNIFASKKTKSQTSQPIQKQQSQFTVAQRFDFSQFRPVDRKDIGIRVLWNRGRAVSLLSSWNPFSDDIPWLTIKDHPIYGSEDQNSSIVTRENFNKIRHIYSSESLYNALIGVFATSNPGSVNFNCCFEDGPILMENYVGISAVIHNKNNFGFFKCRGKFSF